MKEGASDGTVNEAALRHAGATGTATEAERHVRHTLPLRVELSRQLRRRRTLLTFGFLLLLPWLLVTAFAVDGGDDGGGASRWNLLDLATTGAFNFTVFTLYVSAGFLLVVVVALFCGDTVASEAEWSSLRYLLAAPVPRMRLLRQKLVVALGLSAAGVLTLALMSLLAGGLVYGWQPIELPVGGPDPGVADSLMRIGIVVGYLMVALLVVAGTAFALTVATDSPLGAVGGAVALIIMSNILEAVDALGAIREFLPAYWMFAWTDALRPELPWDGMVQGAAVSFSYATVLVAWAFRHFRDKDVVS